MSYGVNAPKGLVPVRHGNGNPWTGGPVPYRITSGYNTSIFLGDPVKLAADGSIVLAAAGDLCVGIFAGASYRPSAFPYYQRNGHWVANTVTFDGSAAVGFVYDDPFLVFSVQESNAAGAAGTPLALADINLNIEFLYTAGDTTTGLSKVTINNETEATSSARNFRIVGLTSHPSNVVGSFANWDVAWNRHVRIPSGTATGQTGV